MTRCRYCDREATEEVVRGEFMTIGLCGPCAQAFEDGGLCARGFLQLQGPKGPPGPAMPEDIVEIGESIDAVRTALNNVLLPILESMQKNLPVAKSAMDDAMRELEGKGLVRWGDGGWKRVSTEDEP